MKTVAPAILQRISAQIGGICELCSSACNLGLMESRYEDFLRDVLITLHMNLRELRERKLFADPEELTYIDAKLTAYEEMLSILRDSASEFGIPGRELGL